MVVVVAQVGIRVRLRPPAGQFIDRIGARGDCLCADRLNGEVVWDLRGDYPGYIFLQRQFGRRAVDLDRDDRVVGGGLPFGLSVCRDETYRADMLAALDRLCRDAEENLARARAWSQARLAELLPFRHLYVLGCGSGLGAAREAALKLLETNYLPVSCYPLDEYLHGIQNALDESACLLCLLPPEGEDRSRMLRLADFARSVGARCALLSPDGSGEGETLHLLHCGREELQPLEFLPALQMLAADLSAARGIDTSRRRYPDFFSLMGSKMEGTVCPQKR